MVERKKKIKKEMKEYRKGERENGEWKKDTVLSTVCT
jgi:hypothetical protein